MAFQSAKDSVPRTMRMALAKAFKDGKKTRAIDAPIGSIVVALGEGLDANDEPFYLTFVVGHRSNADDDTVNFGLVGQTGVDDNWWANADDEVVILVPSKGEA